MPAPQSSWHRAYCCSGLLLPACLTFSSQLQLRPLDEPMLIYSQLSFPIPRQSQGSKTVSPDEVLEISYKDLSPTEEESCRCSHSKLNEDLQQTEVLLNWQQKKPDEGLWLGKKGEDKNKTKPTTNKNKPHANISSPNISLLLKKPQTWFTYL